MSHRSLRFYAPSYRRVARYFRNWPVIAWHHYWRRDPQQAVFWNGRTFQMPQGRTGLVDTVVEMWGAEAYTSDGFYEPAPNDVVLDIGANVGAFSLWLSQQSPSTRIVAVEPSRDNVDMLERNLSGWPHRISIRQAALGGRSGVGLVIDGGRRSIDHRVEFVDGLDNPAAGRLRVPVTTLEELLASLDAGQVDFLKMDIEGGEHDVFRDLESGSLRRIKKMALEYHDNLRPGTLDIVQRAIRATHTVVSMDGSSDGYGILRAVAKS